MTTWTGIDIYDPNTETFSHEPDTYLRKLYIPDGGIIFKDVGNREVKNALRTYYVLHRYDQVR